MTTETQQHKKDGLMPFLQEWKLEKTYSNLLESMLRNGYSRSDTKLITKAAVLSMYAHQTNTVEKKRRRQTTEAYSVHPLEMATRAVDSHLDWVTVAAVLLHDVPEDVKTTVKQGTENLVLDEPKKWLRYIEETFADDPDSGRDNAKILADVIKGVTNRDLPNDPEEKDRLIEAMYNIPFVRLAKNFIKNAPNHAPDAPTDGKPTDDEMIEVAGVVNDLLHLFDSALTSPEHWRIFFVKILDTWHNWDSAHVIKAKTRESSKQRAKTLTKILRARVAISLAEWMGWDDMKTDLIERVSQTLDLSAPLRPQEPQEMITEKQLRAQLEEAQRNDMPKILPNLMPLFTSYKNDEYASITFGWSLPTTRTNRTRSSRYHQFNPVLNVSVPRSWLHDPIDQSMYNNRMYLRMINDPLTNLRALCGRVIGTYDGMYKHQRLMDVVIRSNEPTMKDAFDHRSLQDINDRSDFVNNIPEARFFHPEIGILGPEYVVEFAHLQYGTLLSALYDVQVIPHHANDIVLVMYNGLPYFAQEQFVNDTPLHGIVELLAGVGGLETIASDAYEVRNGLGHDIDPNMRQHRTPRKLHNSPLKALTHHAIRGTGAKNLTYQIVHIRYPKLQLVK